MNLLIIGGTRFVGYHMAVAALARGHRVTILHRGQTGDLPAGAEELLGDRRGDLAPLAGRRWDAVLDTCGYVPGDVRHTGRFLQDAVDLYAFVSTISVYQLPLAPGADEQAPLDEKLPDPPPEALDMAWYGALKVHCERAVDALYPGRALHIRPGIVVGPRDPSDRFTYWVARKARGGAFAVPGPAQRPMQWIDARDLAAWTIQAIERRLTGPYHLVTQPITFGAFLEGLDGPGRPVWVAPERLGEEPERTFPFYVAPEDRGIFQLDPGKAIAAGLTYRDLGATAADTLAWKGDAPLKTGPTQEEERRLLEQAR